MNSYKELIVWQKSVNLVKDVYKGTQSFPNTEQYGLVNQLRRAAVSIPSNIAEGYTRGSTKEYIQFLRMSLGSGAELETQLHIAHELGFLDTNHFQELESLTTEVMKMLNKLIATLVAKS